MYENDFFNENVDYCKYVLRKRGEYMYQITYADVQEIANRYVYELECKDIDTEEEVIEDDELLTKVIDEYYTNDYSEDEMDYDDRYAFINIDLKLEKLYYSMGGYGFNDAYDDKSNDQINDEISLRLNKK